jgi:hypothetical protein
MRSGHYPIVDSRHLPRIVDGGVNGARKERLRVVLAEQNARGYAKIPGGGFRSGGRARGRTYVGNFLRLQGRGSSRRAARRKRGELGKEKCFPSRQPRFIDGVRVLWERAGLGCP